MKLSVVVPVYGCPAALSELSRRLCRVLQTLTSDYEIILVNDACPQNSWEIIKQLCAENSAIVGLELSRNFGQIKAILAGLEYSTGDWIIVMDCDLQDSPEEIPRLLKKAYEGYDAVFARRAVRKDSTFKVFMSKCFYKIYSMSSGFAYDPAVCNFSVCSRKVVDTYCSMRELHRAYIMYIQWMGFRTTVLDVDHHERFEGTSGYNFKKRITMAADIITSQSNILLKFTVLSGITISLMSFAVILIIVCRYFFMNIQPGWSSIMASIFLMGGLMILSVGIVGIYVGNIFMEVKHRPLYIVRTELNSKHNQKKR